MSKSTQAFRTIREVADWIDVAAHVLRFWESKFPQIKPVKRAGGRRYYRPADMELVGGIKVLLHDRGLTIRGVQKMIREEGVAAVAALSPPVEIGDQAVMDLDLELDPDLDADQEMDLDADLETDIETDAAEWPEDPEDADAAEEAAAGQIVAEGSQDAPAQPPEDAPVDAAVDDASDEIAPPPAEEPSDGHAPAAVDIAAIVSPPAPVPDAATATGEAATPAGDPLAEDGEPPRFSDMLVRLHARITQASPLPHPVLSQLRAELGALRDGLAKNPSS
jgi:DNA-binding transcriptional MerR regulator